MFLWYAGRVKQDDEMSARVAPIYVRFYSINPNSNQMEIQTAPKWKFRILLIQPNMAGYDPHRALENHPMAAYSNRSLTRWK